MMRKAFTTSLVAVFAAILSIAAEPQQATPASQPPAAPAPQSPEIGVRITGDTGVTPRYAVPEFVALTPNAAEVARMLGQVLWDDLNFEREFQMIQRDTAATIPAGRTPEQIAFAGWREIGADAVFFGTVEQKGDEVRVQVRLFNVQSRQSVFAEEYTARARSARSIAHTVSDAVHLQQRGLVGVARTRIAFTSDRNNESVLGTVEKRDAKDIYVADYDGANQQRITTGRQLNGFPSWAADARAIAYQGFRNHVAEILVSFIYTGIIETPTRGRFRDGVYLPVFSPDGKQIAFSTTPAGQSAADIHVMNADGTNVRRVTTHPAADTTPTWSPSGAQIAFTSDRGGREQIYYMNVDGSGVTRLPVTDTRTDRATWAPFPYNEIAYSANTGAGWDIKVYEFSTNQTRRLTFGEGTNQSPSYSKTGGHLAFTSTRAGNVQVFTIARDGTGLRQITRAGNNETPDWSN